MDGSLIVIVGFPILYLTGSLHKAAAYLNVRGAAFVLYFACTAALLLLPEVRVADRLAVNFAGLFFCFAPVAMASRLREFPVGLPVAATLCVLLSCMEELICGDYTIYFLPYMEGGVIAVVALVCLGRRAALFAPALAGLFEAAAHTVRLISGMDGHAWMSGICAASVAIAVSFFAGAVRLRAPQAGRHVRHRTTRHAET
jgi:hypothetical protein